MPTIDHITNLLAQFRRYTGSGNMIRANQIMGNIIEAMLELIQNNRAVLDDEQEAVDNQVPAGGDYDGTNPALTSEEVEAVIVPPAAETAIMPDSPVLDAEQMPEPLPVDDGWALPERKPITDEVLDRAIRAEEEQARTERTEESERAAPGETPANPVFVEPQPTEAHPKPTASKPRKSKESVVAD